MISSQKASAARERVTVVPPAGICAGGGPSRRAKGRPYRDSAALPPVPDRRRFGCRDRRLLRDGVVLVATTVDRPVGHVQQAGPHDGLGPPSSPAGSRAPHRAAVHQAGKGAGGSAGPIIGRPAEAPFVIPSGPRRRWAVAYPSPRLPSCSYLSTPPVAFTPNQYTRAGGSVDEPIRDPAVLDLQLIMIHQHQVRLASELWARSVAGVL